MFCYQLVVPTIVAIKQVKAKTERKAEEGFKDHMNNFCLILKTLLTKLNLKKTNQSLMKQYNMSKASGRCRINITCAHQWHVKASFNSEVEDVHGKSTVQVTGPSARFLLAWISSYRVLSSDKVSDVG